jgi:hypothetical protein
MRKLSMAGILAAATVLTAIHAHAAPLIPTLEFEEGPVASIPVTTGSISFGGVVVNGAPVVGSATQKVLQLGGTPTIGGIFNPLNIMATEVNLSDKNKLAKVSAAISGTLAPLSTVSWAVYLDPNNNPDGTADLIASGSFSDPSSIVSLGFFDPVAAVTKQIAGPFSLTDLVTVSKQGGGTVNFNSSVTATFAPVPEPGSLAILGVGLLGLGMLAPMRRQAQAVS